MHKTWELKSSLFCAKWQPSMLLMMQQNKTDPQNLREKVDLSNDGSPTMV